MSLPSSLLNALETVFESANKSVVRNERYHLTKTYGTQKREDLTRRIQNTEQRLSYLATRFPATYAACEEVFGRLTSYDLSLTSLLDIGAGPGTASFCAQATFPNLKNITLIDQDKEFKNFADAVLATFTPNPGHYNCQDLLSIPQFSPHDLVVFSYSLNELSEKNAHAVLQKAWQATKQALVIIEPGTLNAFKGLKKLREALIDAGAHIAAPCPHHNDCPLSTDDWCHFSVRLERTPLHKYIKEATVSYEDEKFSYLIALKNDQKMAPLSRIIKKPRKRPGHVIFDLCTSNGLQQETLSKKDKMLYKKAQKLKWGDCLTDEKVNEHD